MNGTPRAQITALLHRYAQMLDAGEFAAVAEMFTDAAIHVNGAVVGTGSEFVRAMMTGSVIIHPDGTPRTRHVIASPSIDLITPDHAVVESQYTVLQASPAGALVVMVGRHHDTVRLRDGAWQFATRDYGDITFTGDTSRHLRS